MVRSERISVAGLSTLVRTAGETKATEAVVFVHGNPGSSADFTDLLARLAPHARAIAPDMPGYGHSDRSSTFEATVPGYAAYLGAVLAKLGIERAHLVLHDFGGPWGLAWAASNPEKVASVTLFDIGILPGYRWHKYARIWRTPLLGEAFMALTTEWTMRTLMNAENPKPFANAFVKRMFQDIDRGTKDAILRLYRASPDLGALTLDLADRLQPLNLPALVVWGAADAALPSTYAEQQKRFFPRAEVHVLEGCGHWPFIDDPERVAALVVPFLRRQLRAGVSDHERHTLRRENGAT